MLGRDWSVEHAVVVALLAAVVVGACAGKRLDLGADEAAPTAGNFGDVAAPGVGGSLSSPGDPGRPWPPDEVCTAVAGSPWLGTWKGHWPDEYVAVDLEATLILTGVTADGRPCGTLTLGDGAPLLRATDPDAVYPPGATFGGGSNFGVQSQSGALWPGFAYQLVDVRGSDSRIAFVLSFSEVLRSWCKLQPEYADSGRCLPATAVAAAPVPDRCWFDTELDAQTLSGCMKALYCGADWAPIRCACRDQRCDAAVAQSLRVDLHWDGDSLEGAVDDTRLIFLDPVRP
ncbi:MAG TPA: hypothetical protein VEQ59_25205 [Polyangiaceae bacterium]|nr:hypothetical protein [Polyangiaceae bacterium]